MPRDAMLCEHFPLFVIAGETSKQAGSSPDVVGKEQNDLNSRAHFLGDVERPGALVMEIAALPHRLY